MIHTKLIFMVLFREKKMERVGFTVYAVFHYCSAIAPYPPNHLLSIRLVGDL